MHRLFTKVLVIKYSDRTKRPIKIAIAGARELEQERQRTRGFFGGRVTDERVLGGRGSRVEGRERKAELPKAGGEGIRKKGMA